MLTFVWKCARRLRFHAQHEFADYPAAEADRIFIIDGARELVEFQEFVIRFCKIFRCCCRILFALVIKLDATSTGQLVQLAIRSSSLKDEEVSDERAYVF